VSVDCSLCVLS